MTPSATWAQLDLCFSVMLKLKVLLWSPCLAEPGTQPKVLANEARTMHKGRQPLSRSLTSEIYSETFSKEEQHRDLTSKTIISANHLLCGYPFACQRKPKNLTFSLSPSFPFIFLTLTSLRCGVHSFLAPGPLCHTKACSVCRPTALFLSLHRFCPPQCSFLFLSLFKTRPFLQCLFWALALSTEKKPWVCFGFEEKESALPVQHVRP